MSEEPHKDLFVGAETKEGVRVEGPLSAAEASSKRTIIEGKEGTFATQTHASNLGEALLKILTTFINREKFNIIKGF